MVEENLKKITRKRFVGELFQELGFSVQMTGCGVLPHPFLQVKQLLFSDDETQRLSEQHPEVFRHQTSLHTVDFILTHPNGSVKYLKVIDQDSVVLSKEGFDIFDIYPDAIVLSMASYWSDPALKDMVFSDDADPALIDQIRDSFFQVHHVEQILQDHTKISTCSLQEWLAKEFGMFRDILVERYIAMVISWPFTHPHFM